MKSGVWGLLLRTLPICVCLLDLKGTHTPSADSRPWAKGFLLGYKHPSDRTMAQTAPSRAAGKQEGEENSSRSVSLFSLDAPGQSTRAACNSRRRPFCSPPMGEMEVILSGNQEKNSTEHKAAFLGSCSQLQITGEQVLHKYGVSITITISATF